MRILIVDDNQIVRLGIFQLLQNEWPKAQIDEASSIRQAIDLFEANPAQLIVLDLSLPDAKGVEGPARLLPVVKGAPIMVVSLNEESAYAEHLFKMGVAGYVSKGKASKFLIVAARCLLDGGRFVSNDAPD